MSLCKSLQAYPDEQMHMRIITLRTPCMNPETSRLRQEGAGGWDNDELCFDDDVSCSHSLPSHWTQGSSTLSLKIIYPHPLNYGFFSNSNPVMSKLHFFRREGKRINKR